MRIFIIWSKVIIILAVHTITKGSEYAAKVDACIEIGKALN